MINRKKYEMSQSKDLAVMNERHKINYITHRIHRKTAGTAAALMMMLSIPAFAATPGWMMESDTWYYKDSNGDMVTEQWRKSGDKWFYLDENGEMLKSSLVENNGEYYYVNSSGAMVGNEWRQLENDDDDDDDDNASDTCWYYFQNNGKAYRAASGKTSFKPIKKANGETKKYAFDEEGKMLYGWIGEDAQRLTDENDWAEGIYYCGIPDDGAQVSGAWQKLSVVDEENDDDQNPDYWFYLNTNGKKLKDQTKTINGRKYLFEEKGVAKSEWHPATRSNATSSDAYSYFNLPDQCWRAAGWFYTVPDENIDKEAFDNDEAFWFYADKNGDLLKNQIKSINGRKYAFNEYGEMLQGLYQLELDSNQSSVILSSKEIETENDLPEADDTCEVYYFGGSPDGSMETGSQNITVDGERYDYNFKDSGSKKGAGYNEINQNSIYVKGKKIKADRDEKLKVVEYNEKEYLVNTSGALAKSKKNVQDGDDIYYCTDKNGVVTYQGEEKYGTK